MSFLMQTRCNEHNALDKVPDWMDIGVGGLTMTGIASVALQRGHLLRVTMHDVENNE